MHTHDNGDELFYVVKGAMEMRFKDYAVPVKEGGGILVPKGIGHHPRTAPEDEVHLPVVERFGTAHTRNIESEKTVTSLRARSYGSHDGWMGKSTGRAPRGQRSQK